jgi:two-component system OmpR family response regulator
MTHTQEFCITHEVLPMEILIIEDDPVIGKAVQRGLEEAGHECQWLKDGTTGLEAAQSQKHQAIILDLMIPGESGLSIQDRVVGLNKGADDYLVKPFAMPELLARIEAVCRRSTLKPSAVLEVGNIQLDLSTRCVRSEGVEIELTPTEFGILELLMRYAGQVVTRKMLCEGVWTSDWEGTTNVIEVHINRLRSKLQQTTTQPLIHTIRGRGYALRATP